MRGLNERKEKKLAYDLAGRYDRGRTSVCGNAAKWTVEIFDKVKLKI